MSFAVACGAFAALCNAWHLQCGAFAALCNAWYLQCGAFVGVFGGLRSLAGVMLPQNVEVRLQLWDIGGQSIGAKMLSNYIYGSDAIVFVYDVTNYQSFQNLEDWMQLVNNTVAGSECLKVLVANKSDLDHLRAVKKEKHEDYTEEHFMNKWSFYVSAKTGDQVEPTFVRIAAELAGINLSYNDLIVPQSP